MNINELLTLQTTCPLAGHPKVPLEIVETLLQDQHYHIAGGYPRDLFFGIEPNDIDCWVQWVPPVDGIGRGNMDVIEQRLDDMGIPYEEFDMYGTEDDRHRLAVLRCPGLDIIFMGTLDGLIGGFDFNINQFYWEPGLGPVYAGKTDLNQGLVQLKFDPRVEERKRRMQAKWDSTLGQWRYEELTGSFYGNGVI